jgi:phosphoheptose isomerase
MLDASYTLSRCFERGGKVLICGNGGSAADSQHLAAEFVGRFVIPNRPALPAIALTADTSILTAWSNDFDYSEVFSRQVEAYGQPGDVLIGISTSGKSANLVKAFKAAKQKEMICIGLLGKDGGDVLELSDIALVIPSTSSQRIQELHINILHTICELVEQQLFLQPQQHKQRSYSYGSLNHLMEYLDNSSLIENYSHRQMNRYSQMDKGNKNY